MASGGGNPGNKPLNRPYRLNQASCVAPGFLRGGMKQRSKHTWHGVVVLTGCVIVGAGASHCGEETLNFGQLKALIGHYESVKKEGEAIQRQFTVGDNGVVLNHYDVQARRSAHRL